MYNQIRYKKIKTFDIYEYKPTNPILTDNMGANKGKTKNPQPFIYSYKYKETYIKNINIYQIIKKNSKKKKRKKEQIEK